MGHTTKLFALFLFSLISLSCAGYNTFPPERAQGLEKKAALQALIESGQTVGEGEYRIVDVRPPSKYGKAHIPTAINLPNGNLEGEDIPPKDKFIIVYCETGGRAQKAAQKMEKAGYTKIYNWGGFGKWNNE